MSIIIKYKTMKSTVAKASLDGIKEFMNQKNMALAGVSLNKMKFGNSLFKELKNKNYTVYPVHPTLESFEGEKCYPDLNHLPSGVTALIICTKPANVLPLVQEAVARNIRHIWLQQGAQNDEAIRSAIDNGVNVIHRECVMMFANPVVSVHNTLTIDRKSTRLNSSH